MIHSLKPFHYLLISISTLLAGIVFYGIYNDFIIIRFPLKTIPTALTTNAQKKNFKLFYWFQDKWHTEEKELLAQNTVKTLTYLVTSWLALLEDERVMDKKVSVQSVLTDALGTEAYISFDRNPFSKESSTYQKLMWIEGLLKTIRENGIPLKNIRFLVHHRPLQDQHLDFSSAWPLTGYL